MFAPAFATPFTSFAPMPPTPMQATLTVSLGARRPRPSTWRGTMVNATPAPTSPTNFRLEMRLRDMMRLSSVGCHGRGRARAPRAKQRCEQEQDDRGEPGGQHPEPRPLCQREAGCAAEDAVVHVAGQLGADEHAEAVGDQYEEALGLAADRRRRTLVHVDLAGHEEEVVADAMEQDPDEDEGEDRRGSGHCEQRVPHHPGGHTDHEHPLHTE